jgi:hypothetical protein
MVLVDAIMDCVFVDGWIPFLSREKKKVEKERIGGQGMVSDGIVLFYRLCKYFSTFVRLPRVDLQSVPSARVGRSRQKHPFHEER